MEVETVVEQTPAASQVASPSNGSTSNADKSNGDSSSKKDTPRRDGGRNARRDRNNRSRRRSRSPVRNNRNEDRQSKVNRRVYVANIPFDIKWGDLKDLFRDKVGNVRFCQLFENEEGKPRGCGLVEFEDSASAKKAIEVLNRFDYRGRELVVKEDLDIDRDRYGRLVLPSRKSGGSGGGSADRDSDLRDDRSRFDDRYRKGSDSVSSSNYNTYGLSSQFLNSLGIKGPLSNRVFIANLDYKASERKLEDIFKLAGNVIRVKLYADQDGKSKGYGIVEFEHPVEAVQSISMFNNQKLYDRILSVRLDKFDNEDPFGNDSLPSKLPTGLEGIGKGLGIGGQPLNIAKSMINNQNPIGSVQSSVATGVQSSPVVPPQAATAAISALTNLAGNLQNLPSLAQSLAQLSNNAGISNSSIQPVSGYSSVTNDLSSINMAPSNPPVYGGYSTVPQPSNGAAQQTPYQNNPLPPSNYGQIPSNVPQAISYPSNPVNAPAPISSYSGYDQREYCEDKYRPPTLDTIFVRNLPPSFSWQNLRDRFNEVGEVRFAEMKGHGNALVRFGNDRDAQRAVDLMNGIRIDNRAIEVSLYY